MIIRHLPLHRKIQIGIPQEAGNLPDTVLLQMNGAKQPTVSPTHNACPGRKHQVINGEIIRQDLQGRIQITPRGYHPQAPFRPQTAESRKAPGTDCTTGGKQRPVQIRDNSPHPHRNTPTNSYVK